MDNRDERPLDHSAPLEEQNDIRDTEKITSEREPVHQNTVLNNQPVSAIPHYSGFWMRVWSYLFDLLVIGALNGLLIFPVFRLTGIAGDGGMFSAISIATTVTYFAYFVLMTKFFRQTLGKMVFGLRVISLKGTSLSWSTVIFRELVGRYIHTGLTIFGIPLLMVLYATVSFTPKKQGIHDFIADTSVVHERTVLSARNTYQNRELQTDN